MNTATITPPPTPSLHSRQAARQRTNISRGAAHYGLGHQSVFLETDILTDYCEADPTVGQNTIGVVLSVLQRHLSQLPAVERSDTISARLHRRDDGKEVDLYLSVMRSRQHGQDRLLIDKLGDEEPG